MKIIILKCIISSLLNLLQVGFHHYHCSQTIFVNSTNDFHIIKSNNFFLLHNLLHLSAASDLTDHSLLLEVLSSLDFRSSLSRFSFCLTVFLLSGPFAFSSSFLNLRSLPFNTTIIHFPNF